MGQSKIFKMVPGHIVNFDTPACRKLGISSTQHQFSVHVDRKGYVLIPAEIRKAMGIAPKSLMLLSQARDEIRLEPAEVIPKRKIRKIPREELAQLQKVSVIPEKAF